jgi:hypothetical protein
MIQSVIHGSGHSRAVRVAIGLGGAISDTAQAHAYDSSAIVNSPLNPVDYLAVQHVTISIRYFVN